MSEDDLPTGPRAISWTDSDDQLASLFATAQALRVTDAWRGGKDHYQVDRIPATAVATIAEWVPAGVRASRGFVLEAVAAAVDSGLDQILDIGTGLPLQPYLHDIAWKINPKVLIAYVPDGFIAATHARAILARFEHALAVDAEFARPLELIAAADFVLDLERPLLVVLDGVLDHVADAEVPDVLFGDIRGALAPGSRVVVTHFTADPGLLGDRHAPTIEALERYNAAVVPPLVPRTPAELERLLDGWQLLEPGLVALGRSGTAATDSHDPLPMLGAVGVLAAAGADAGR